LPPPPKELNRNAANDGEVLTGGSGRSTIRFMW
jgi:hypothetical protein